MSAKRNASLISKTIQNELAACAGKIIKEDIIKDVKKLNTGQYLPMKPKIAQKENN